MAEVNPPGWIQALATHTAEQMRSYLGSLLASPAAASSLKTASGIHPGLGTAFAVTQNGTPNMSVNIAAGLGFIQGTEGTKQGTYFIENDASVNKAITASDPTNPRIDIVVAKVQDAAYSGATNSWSLAVVTGTPAGSPSPPSAPNNSTTIAQIAVAANTTAIVTGNITDKRTYAAGLGGHINCTSALRPTPTYSGMMAFETDTLRPIWSDGTNWKQFGVHVCTSGTRPAAPFNGMRIYETDTSLNYQWNGTKWIRDLVVLRKDADTAFLANNTTPQNDPDLFFPMDTNSKYSVDAHLACLSSGTAVPIGVGFTFPAGGTFDTSREYLFGSVYFNDWQNLASGTVSVISGSNSLITARFGGTITTVGTAGTFQVTAAETVSNAFQVKLLRGSRVSYKQVA